MVTVVTTEPIGACRLLGLKRVVEGRGATISSSLNCYLNYGNVHTGNFWRINNNKLGYIMDEVIIDNSVKAFRVKRGLTTSALSRLTNGEFSTSRLSNYETGLRGLTVDAAKKLSPHLDASPAQLLNLADTFFTDVKLGEHQEELVRLLQKVSLRGDVEVKRVIGMLNGYLNS